LGQAIAEQLCKLGYEVDAPSHDTLDVLNPHVAKKYDLLVNNAGICNPAEIYEDMHGWISHIEINLIGAYRVARLLTPSMVINISAAAALWPKATWSAYSTSKAGMVTMTLSAAAEGLHWRVICPSRIATKMHTRLFPDEPDEVCLSTDSVAQAVCYCLLPESPVVSWVKRIDGDDVFHALRVE